jgi:acyl carrier protein
MPDDQQTLDEILNLAAVQFKVPREKLAPDDDFFKTLGIDSLQALDLLTRLEHHFNVELPDYELQGVSDFRTLASRIQARVQERLSIEFPQDIDSDLHVEQNYAANQFSVYGSPFRVLRSALKRAVK